MADLQDLFKDYLVSYTVAPIPGIQEIPETRYTRMIDYIASKSKENKKEEKSEEKSEDKEEKINQPVFTHWSYYFEEPDVNKSSSKAQVYKGKSSWINDMKSAYKRLGLNDNAIKNLIAKNALESNWGASTNGNFNFGNITAGKYWKGRTVDGKDKDKNGKSITNRFREYESLDDFVKDEINFLTKLYDFDQNDDIITFLNKLQGGNSEGRKYAEDPFYKSKVSNVYLKI